MKKVISVLLALVMMCACWSALAEEVDFTGEDVTIALEEREPLPIEQAEDSYAPGVTDIVSKNGNKYTAVAPECTYVLDVSAIPSATVLTQDMSVSFESYLCLNNPLEIQKMMVEEGLHFVVIDFETKLEVDFLSADSDKISIMVQDMNTLSEANRNIVIMANELDGAKEIGGRCWLYKTVENKGYYYTVYNAYPIIVQFSGTSLEDDIIDVETLLANLTIR